MRKIQKPEWLLYAEKVRIELNNLPCTKSGKRLDRHELDAWKKAMAEMNYQGSLRDWQFLIRNLGRKKHGQTGDFL
jgi:hypothetical protein